MAAIDPRTGHLSQAELERLDALPLEEMGEYLATYVKGVAKGLRDHATPEDALELREELHELSERYLRRLRAKLQAAREAVESAEATNRMMRREVHDVRPVKVAIANLAAVAMDRERMVAEMMQSLTDAAAAC